MRLNAMKVHNQQWNRYREWAETHVEPDPRSPAQIMADVDWLYRGYPEDVRRTDPDPDKTGVQELYRIFALLDALYERQRQSRINARTNH
jgi:hypothetical protein